MRHDRWSSWILTLCVGVVVLTACACQASSGPAVPGVGGGPAVVGAATNAAAAPSNIAAAAPQPAAPVQRLRPLRIQVSSQSAAFAWLYVTKGVGLFEQYGLDAEIITMSGSVGIAALQANELDFMAAAGSATRAAIRGLPIRLVYVEATGPDQLLVGAQGITSVEQLRGKVVTGTGPVGNVNALITELLRLHGVAPGSYELLTAGDATARIASLTSGIASGTMLGLADLPSAKREGYPVLDQVSGKIGLIWSGLAANTSALQSNRDHLRDALQAILAGRELMQTQRERVLPILAREFEISLEDAGDVYDGLVPGRTPDGKPDAAAVRFEFEMDQREMELTEPIRAEQVFDFSLLDAARARR
jgi:ABC-type nitrate/sulfonate/bicarbonate transport system substrate-binding protein